MSPQDVSFLSWFINQRCTRDKNDACSYVLFLSSENTCYFTFLDWLRLPNWCIHWKLFNSYPILEFRKITLLKSFYLQDCYVKSKKIRSKGPELHSGLHDLGILVLGNGLQLFSTHFFPSQRELLHGRLESDVAI